MTLIFIIGKVASGKDFVANYISSKINFPVINISDVVKKFAGQNATRDDLQDEFRKHSNNTWLLTEIMKQIKNLNYIINGIREPHILYSLLKYNRDFSLILKLNCSDVVRYFRLCDRQQQLVTIEEFQRINDKDKLLGIDFLMNMKKDDFKMFNYKIEFYEIDTNRDQSDVLNSVMSILSKHLLLTTI